MHGDLFTWRIACVGLILAKSFWVPFCVCCVLSASYTLYFQLCLSFISEDSVTFWRGTFQGPVVVMAESRVKPKSDTRAWAFNHEANLQWLFFIKLFFFFLSFPVFLCFCQLTETVYRPKVNQVCEELRKILTFSVAPKRPFSAPWLLHPRPPATTTTAPATVALTSFSGNRLGFSSPCSEFYIFRDI